MPTKKLVLFFIFFIQAALLSVCQNNSQHANCPLSFQCGTITNTRYPFWGGDRPLSCGYPGFELDCPSRGNVPLLMISSSTYRVLGIDFSARTLRVARQDFWNTTCPTTSLLRSTTLNPYIFQFPPNSDYENITLYYGCTNISTPGQLLNQFTCDANGDTTSNLFRTGSGSSAGPGTGITCRNNISIPVNQTTARALESPTANSSINVLQDALANGFSVTWSADTNDVCDSCRGSGGTCGCDRSVCYMDSGGSVAVWGVCRVDSRANTSQGLPPVQGPSPLSSDGPSPLGSDGPSPSSSDSPLHLGRGSSSNRVLRNYIVLVLGVTGAGLLIFFSIFCCIRRRRTRGSHNSESNLNVEQFLLQHGSLALKRYKYSEIKKMTKSLSDKLGEGGYGSVYKGKLPDGSFVAVKVLTDTGSNGEDFINEVASISRTSHVNIVNLLGFCFDSKHRALVYEYMPNKSLDKYIGGSSTGSDNLDIEILYMISVGVAKGLEYLHTGCNTRIVHFDIKPQNILLDEDFCPKISDFGLAKLCKKKQSLMSVMGTRGTVGYIAPEVFSRNFGGVSHKSDVYSYGMMVLEMAGANTICVDHSNETSKSSSENYFPDKIYERVVDITRRLDGFEIEEEEETARKMFLVGFWCIQTNPAERPSISKVLEMLEGTLESIQIPPKPVLFTPTLPVLGELSSSFSSNVDETQPSAEGIVET